MLLLDRQHDDDVDNIRFGYSHIMIWNNISVNSTGCGMKSNKINQKWTSLSDYEHLYVSL